MPEKRRQTDLLMSVRRGVRNLLRWIEDHLQIHVFPRDRILSAVSTDGVIWHREPGIRVDVGGEHGSEMVYWPHVFRFPEVLRMYFTGSVRTGRGWNERILSAVSADGLAWEVEPGERVSPGDELDRFFVSAPCVARISGGYRMYYAGSGEGKKNWVILSAVSGDGLSWRKEKGVRLTPLEGFADSVNAPCLVPAENGWRMYFSSSKGYRVWIDSAVSEDGLDWRHEPGPCLGLSRTGPRVCVCHPSVVALADRKYRMYFTGHDGCALGARIYSAISSDGLNWKVEGENLNYSGPFEGAEVNYVQVVEVKPSLWRMYYTGFWGKHLLLPQTYRHWKRQAYRIRKELQHESKS